MGMPLTKDLPNTVDVPDTYGLPVFPVSNTIQRRIGDKIHVLCGQEVFGQMQWSHVIIIDAVDAARESAKASVLALCAEDTGEMDAAIPASH